METGKISGEQHHANTDFLVFTTVRVAENTYHALLDTYTVTCTAGVLREGYAPGTIYLCPQSKNKVGKN